MKIKHQSKSNNHQRKMNTSTSTPSSSTDKPNDFEIKRRIISDNQQQSTNFDDKSTFFSRNQHQYCSPSSTHHGATIKPPSTSDTLIGFIPLILLIAILSCFVFGVFTIIKLAVNHAYKEDYD